MTVGVRGESVGRMKTQSDRQHWFVLLNGKRHGPFTYAELTKAAREGLITGQTNIWRSGWQKWHPARSVKGLLAERGPANERPVNETPLAPDGTEWVDEHVRAPAEATFQFAPPNRREARRSKEVAALRLEQPPVEDKTDYIFAEEWRMLAEQPPVQDRSKAVVPTKLGRKAVAKVPDLDAHGYDDLEYRPLRDDPADRISFAGRLGKLFRRAVVALGAILLLAGGGWILRESGVVRALKSASAPRLALMSAPGDLPASVASLPAVMALQRNDPSAFERFKKRYVDGAVNARDDEVLSLARAALRKSVKHLLAIASGDVLLEITATSLAYMQGLQATNPESCVALSDESKGAKLTSNLAKDFPTPFSRDMSVLERIAGTNPHTAIAPMTSEEARPYFETVFNTLRRQSVKTELLPRERLDPSDFAAYCTLVIAFYQAVLDLPRDDKVNLLRYLYAAAALHADSDLKK
jgi:GYF domain 2